MPDKMGTPMKVSAMVTYKINNPLAAIYNVEDYESYIHDQAMEVVKRVCSRFHYRTNNPFEPSLMNDSTVIGKIFIAF